MALFAMAYQEMIGTALSSLLSGLWSGTWNAVKNLH